MFKRMGVIIFSVGTIGILVIVGFYFFGTKSKIEIVDHLCNFIRKEQKMDCVAVLAADTFMKPGAIVDYQGTLKKPDRVPMPIGDLFGPECLVPGADDATISRDLSAPQPISIPQFTYNSDRNLKVGADVEVPQAEGGAIKAGPKWSEVSKIELSADDAWVVRVDEMLAVRVVGSCRIQQDCVERVDAGEKLQ